MSRTIWKFEADIAEDVTIRMPEGAQILDVTAPDPYTLLVWATVDPAAEEVERRLHVRGTGHILGDVGHHIATLPSGPFVWHIFEAADR